MNSSHKKNTINVINRHKCTNFHGCRETHHFVCTSAQPAAWNIQWFFSTCALSPFARVEVQKKKVWGKEGGGDGVNEGKGRASSRKECMSEPETDWEMQGERERARERLKTQLTLFQATPLSNSPCSACIPLASWQHASQSHAWLLSQSRASLQLCILDFIFTMATQACSWPWMWPV